MKKRLFSLFIAGIFTFSFMTMAFADELSSKKSELNSVNGKINDIKGQISDVKNQQNNILDDLDKLDTQISSIQDSMDNTNSQISSVQAQIKDTNQQLNNAIQDFQNEEDLYSARIRAMYINGPSSYLDIIFSAESFSDFISRTDLVRRIIDNDRNILSTMQQKEADVQKKKGQLVARQNQLVALQQSLSSQQSQMQTVSNQKKAYYSELNNNKIELQSMLDKEQQESDAIANEIRDIEKKMASSGNGQISGSTTGILRISDIGYVPPITSPFGMRYHPILHKYELHTGIDIGVPTGTPVYAMADGVVIIAHYNVAYGNVVVIDHGNGLTSLYGHNSKLLVHEGEHVTKGQLISKSGATGYATGPHLHFEVRINGTPVNPAPYYILGK